MAGKTDVEPLSMQAVKTRCEGEAFAFEDLSIFHEIPMFCQVNDFMEFGKPERLWASPSWCHHTSETLEQFLAYDFAGNCSDHMKKKCVDLANEVQIEKNPQHFEWVITANNRQPRRLINLMYPINLRRDDEDKTLIAIVFYNADNSTMDPETCDVPIDFHFEVDVCKRTHKFPDSLAIVDGFPVFTAVLDFQDSRNPKKLWANAAWLNLLGQTLEEFQTSDPNGDSLALTSEVMTRLGQQVQRGRQVVSHPHVICINRQPTRVVGVFRPVLFEGMDLPLVICTYVPPLPDEPESGCSAAQQSALEYNEQVWTIVELRAIIFDGGGDASAGCAVWANIAARNEYNVGWFGIGQTQRQESLKTKDGATVDFRAVLSSCEWECDEDLDAACEELGRMKLNSAPVMFTRRKMRQRATDASLWHQLTFSPCSNPYTGKSSVLLQEIDVTNLMNIQQELEESNELKDRFLQCVSHELRTPLHGILNLSGSLATASDCPPRLRKTLVTIEESALHLNGIVNDILETAACMSGHVLLSTTTFSLAQLCERVCDEKRGSLKEGVVLNNAVSEDCAVVADAYKLDRIFSHLIDNASKFTSSGSITITSELEDHGFVRIDVEDTGCGIAEEMLDIIWEHFQQGDMSAEREHGGTGLGLALVKCLVHAHSGHVSVRSTQGEGSTFSFTMPTFKTEQSASLSGGPQHRSKGKSDDKKRYEWQRRWSAEEKLREKMRATKRLSTLNEEVAADGAALDKVREAEAKLQAEQGKVAALQARVDELEAAAATFAGEEATSRSQPAPSAKDSIAASTEQEETIRELQETVESLQSELLQAGKLENDKNEQLQRKEMKIKEQERKLGELQDEIKTQESKAAAGWHEEMVASVSHELRTPLNGIIGLSESLIQNPACNELMIKTLKLIKTSGMRLSGLVNDILDKAATKNGKFVIRNEPVALRSVSEQVCDVVAPLCSAKVKLENRVDEQLPLIEGDSARINQILTNLISNAIKFTQSGSVTVSSKLIGNSEVMVEVTDTGIGIPASKLEQIWTRFDRGDDKTAKEFGGTGLGLSLVKELVEAHHGSVGAKSNMESGKSGTTVWVVLPIKQPPSLQSSRGSTPRGSVNSPKLSLPAMIAHGLSSASGSASYQSEATELEEVEAEGKEADGQKVMHHSELFDTFEILSVDDNMVNHIVVENSLVPRGYQVTKCMGGVEALNLLETRGFLPDLILLDCMMPGMSGYEMCERLREKYPCNTLPVIMVSAKDKEDDVVKGLKAGCNDYLSKPFGSSELNARIEVQLNLKYLWSVEIHRLMGDRAAILHLPEELQEQMRSGAGAVAVHKKAAVLVCDLEDMLVYVQTLPANELAAVVNSLYDLFDQIASKEGMTRIVDDTYMIVLTDELMTESEQIGQMLLVAEEMLAATQTVRVTLAGERKAPRVRIGVGTGEVYSSMVGITLPYYTFFGPGVRSTAKLTLEGFAGCALVSAETFEILAPAEREQLSVYGYHRRQRRGDAAVPCTYIAKFGRYVEALGTMNRRGDDDWVSEPDAPQLNSAQSHLRAFLRLSSNKSYQQLAFEDSTQIAPFASMTNADNAGCTGCVELSKRCGEVESEWLQKYSELEQKLYETNQKLKKMNTDSLMSEFSDTSGGSKTFAMPEVPNKDVNEITVLSVDDDPVNQMVVENLLDPLGYKIVTCMTGIEALEHLRTCSRIPDLVLLDMMMPHMNGIECCQKLRETYNRTTLPVIMVSAKTAVESVVEGLEAGCNDYVSKPFNRIELLARISTQLRVRDASRNEVENVKSTKLLQKLLPAHVVARLKNGTTNIVEEHKEVSILAVGIVGYTSLCATLPTADLIRIFNELSSCIDDLCDRHGCSKVDGGGDSLMVVAGHDGATGDHAGCVVRLALDLLRAVQGMRLPQNGAKHVQLRIGVHSGQVFAGVVGSKVPRYSFFGDAVVTAFGMEATGYAMNVQVSAATAGLLNGRWELQDMGVRNIKGKGRVDGFLIRDELCAWEAALTKARLEVPSEAVDTLHSAHASFSLPNTAVACGSEQQELSRLRHEVEMLKGAGDESAEVAELRGQLARMEEDAMRNSRLHAQTLANVEWELRNSKDARELAETAAREAAEVLAQAQPQAGELEAVRGSLASMQDHAASLETQLQLATAARERAERAAREAEQDREEERGRRRAEEGKREEQRTEVERLRECVAQQEEAAGRSSRLQAQKLADLERELEDAIAGRERAERQRRAAEEGAERERSEKTGARKSEEREIERLQESMARMEEEAVRSARMQAQAMARKEAEVEEAIAGRERAERAAREAARAAEEARDKAHSERRAVRRRSSVAGEEQEGETARLRESVGRLEEEAARAARAHAQALGRVQEELEEATVGRERAERRAREAEAVRSQREGAGEGGSWAASEEQRKEVERLRDSLERLERDAARSARLHVQAQARMEGEVEEALAGRERAERKAREAAREAEEAREKAQAEREAGGREEARKEAERLRERLARVEEEAARSARLQAHQLTDLQAELQQQRTARDAAEAAARQATQRRHQRHRASENNSEEEAPAPFRAQHQGTRRAIAELELELEEAVAGRERAEREVDVLAREVETLRSTGGGGAPGLRRATGGRGCVVCGEKEARLQDTQLALDALRLDNSHLAATCAALSDQMRFMTALVEEAPAPPASLVGREHSPAGDRGRHRGGRIEGLRRPLNENIDRAGDGQADGVQSPADDSERRGEAKGRRSAESDASVGISFVLESLERSHREVLDRLIPAGSTTPVGSQAVRQSWARERQGLPLARETATSPRLPAPVTLSHQYARSSPPSAPSPAWPLNRSRASDALHTPHLPTPRDDHTWRR